MYNRGQSDISDIPEIDQKKRRHDIIPGWNGESFRKEPNGQDDILADFRRIPTVWSQLTAGQAEDKNGNPLAPKISIYIRQGKEGVDKSLSGVEPGHAGLGIEYSRYSLVSNRYERYNLRYGFFTGSQESKQGSLAMTGNALIPGQLRSEAALTYSVRRSFSATAKQVNAILKASETYADKGYNSFNRNCTTFVKDMIKDEARIPAGNAIFEQETPGFSSLVNFGMFASKASENTARASIEERFARLRTDNDLNYGGEENRRVNKQDYKNYKDSLAKSKGGYINKADLPNAAVENMRRLEGEDAGQIGSKFYFGTAAVNPITESGSIKESSGLGNIKKPKMVRDNIRDAITNEGNKLTSTILSVTRKGSIKDLGKTPGIDKNAAAIMSRIGSYSAPLSQINYEELDPEQLRDTRSILEKHIDDLNKLLFGFFKNDDRLHLPIMHMISLLEYGITIVDYAYQDSNIGKDNEGDLRNLRGRLNPLNKMEIKYNKKEGNKNQKVSAKLTPSRYEAYLQIYKSPHKAIDKASRYQVLNRKDRRTKAEEAEYQKLKRIDNLAWDYDAAHRYMVEKQSYNQQDIDYTLSLEKMENSEKTAGALPNSFASGIYKALILEKIFGGVTERLENEFTLEEVQNKSKLKSWLENDMVTCIQRKPEEMKKVISGMKKVKPEITDQELLDQLLKMIKKNWISNVFSFNRSVKTKDANSPTKRTGELVPKAFDEIAKGSQLTKKLEELIKQALISDLNGNVLIELD